MDDATKTAALAYAAALDTGDSETITAAAMKLDDAQAADDSGDDFARAVLLAAIEEEAVDFDAVARVIRALFA